MPSYGIMSNHFQILLDVPPMPEDGISDEELLDRLAVFYTPAQISQIWLFKPIIFQVDLYEEAAC